MNVQRFVRVFGVPQLPKHKRRGWSPSYSVWAVYTVLLDPWACLRFEEFNCGHARSPDNTLINRHGTDEIKRCRVCHNNAAREYAARLIESRLLTDSPTAEM